MPRGLLKHYFSRSGDYTSAQCPNTQDTTFGAEIDLDLQWYLLVFAAYESPAARFLEGAKVGLAQVDEDRADQIGSYNQRLLAVIVMSQPGSAHRMTTNGRVGILHRCCRDAL